jgi:hypothetical protein
VECKRLLIHTLELWRERGDDFEVARTLRLLADTNEWLLLPKESILQAKESLGIFERLNNVSEQAQSLQQLAQLLHHDNQLDAAEAAASRSIDLLPDSEQFLAVKVTVSLATYIAPRVRPRRPSTTTRQPSGSRLLSTGTTNSFGSITPWRGCSAIKAGSTTLTLTSTAPSRTQSTTHTIWVVRWSCRL